MVVISFENHDLSLNTVRENRSFGWKIAKIPKSIAHPEMSMMTLASMLEFVVNHMSCQLLAEVD